MPRLIPLAILALSLTLTTQSLGADIDWSKVDTALGKTAAAQGDVHRYGIPRSDLQVTLEGVTIKPALALGGWVAFEPAKDGTMLMGDIVLTENEVTPVMTKLLQSGIEITALHNHLMRTTPATFYMHIRGHGDPVKLATAIREALAESKTPFEPPAASASQTDKVDLDTEKLDQALGSKGKELLRDFTPAKAWDLLRMQFDVLGSSAALFGKWQRDRNARGGSSHRM